MARRSLENLDLFKPPPQQTSDIPKPTDEDVEPPHEPSKEGKELATKMTVGERVKPIPDQTKKERAQEKAEIDRLRTQTRWQLDINRPGDQGKLPIVVDAEKKRDRNS